MKTLKTIKQVHALHSNDGNGKGKAYGNGYFHWVMHITLYMTLKIIVRKVFLFIRSSTEVLDGYRYGYERKNNVRNDRENKIDISIFILSCQALNCMHERMWLNPTLSNLNCWITVMDLRNIPLIIFKLHVYIDENLKEKKRIFFL